MFTRCMRVFWEKIWSDMRWMQLDILCLKVLQWHVENCTLIKMYRDAWLNDIPARNKSHLQIYQRNYNVFKRVRQHKMSTEVRAASIYKRHCEMESDPAHLVYHVLIWRTCLIEHIATQLPVETLWTIASRQIICTPLNKTPGWALHIY